MALVAYDTDCSDDSENEQTHTSNIFNSLPTPKAVHKSSVDVEEDDEFLKKKEVPVETPPAKFVGIKNATRKPAKIFLPSLSSFDNDESEPQPKFKTSSKGTGLLSMLPQPKAEMFMKKPATTFLPNALKMPAKSITKKNISKPIHKNIKPTQSSGLVNNYSSSEDSDASDSEGKPADFFSLNENKYPMIDVPVKVNDFIDETFIESASNEATSEFNSNFYENSIPTDDYSDFNETNADTPLDDEALIKLASSRERRKGESIQVIDINQAEIMPNSREWLTKALTENAPTQISSGKRSGNDFTSQQRRKHQITYLAHQARANEQALQNQWANNRLTRKQTQSKYGF